MRRLDLFTNASIYHIAPDAISALPPLNEALSTLPFVECGPSQLSTSGFISPLGPGEDFTYSIANHILLAFREETKVLPKDALDRRATKAVKAAIERSGQPLTRNERKAIGEQTILDYLPHAVTKITHTRAYLDTKHGRLVIDTGSQKHAEHLISRLRDALGSFPAIPVDTEYSPVAVMTTWLHSKELPDALQLGTECQLKGIDGNGVWRASKADLGADECMEHLRAGKQVHQLGLVFDGDTHYVLTDQVGLRKVSWPEPDDEQESVGQGFRTLIARLDPLIEAMNRHCVFIMPRAAAKDSSNHVTTHSATPVTSAAMAEAQA